MRAGDGMGLFGSGKKKEPSKEKKFRLAAHEIKDIARGHGGCFASDRITVNGLKVGYMYREESGNPQDGGWRFLSGEESQKYLDNPENLGIYDVNTIANLDPDIIPFLNSAVGSRFARKNQHARLLPESPAGPRPREECSVVHLTKEWSLQLAPFFKRRIEDGQLVFWASSRTLWITAWDEKPGESADQRMAWIKKEANPNPVERFEPAHPTLKRFAYLLMESDDEKGARWALYATTVSPVGSHLWICFYFDEKNDLEWALSTWESIEYKA